MTDLDLTSLDPTAFLWAAGALALVVLLSSALAALVERSGPIRLRHWAQSAQGRLLALYEAPPRFEAYRFLLSTTAKVSPVLLGAALVVPLHGWGLGWRLAVILAMAGAAVLAILGEGTGRFLVLWDPEWALERLIRVYRLVLFLTLPLVVLLAPAFRAQESLRRDDEDEDEASAQEIDAYIDVGTQEGILEPGEGELVRRIVDFADTTARSVMTPRIDMECAPAHLGLPELADRFLESGHSRLPLYEGSIDHIVGVLHLRDLLRGLRVNGAEPAADAAPAAQTARSLMMPPVFVPDTKGLGRLFQELRERHQQMAIVVDEFGGTAGLVTVEDLLEQIVGELGDEHEEYEPPEIEALATGGWRVAGGSNVHILEELFDLDLGQVPFETVGGLVFSLLGSVPEAGETVEDRGLLFTVEAVNQRRVEQVRIEPATAPAGEVTADGLPRAELEPAKAAGVMSAESEDPEAVEVMEGSPQESVR